MLKIQDTGLAVRNLQQLLNAAGARPALVADGHFGLKTRDAVMAAQHRLGLVVDGIAGAKTLAALELGQRPSKLLGEHDIVRAADRLGVSVAAVKAVNEVESRGNGFLSDGRPVILFERHIMYRRLAAVDRPVDAIAAAQPSIVSRTRGGYLGGQAEHRRLQQAKLIDYASAIESASWGLFQIMGWHWQALGYDDAGHWERSMNRSEADHLDAFVRFIIANPNLHKALKARKWATFAAGYNGPAYKDNLYDIKLARAYERHLDVEQAA